MDGRLGIKKWGDFILSQNRSKMGRKSLLGKKRLVVLYQSQVVPPL